MLQIKLWCMEMLHLFWVSRFWITKALLLLTCSPNLSPIHYHHRRRHHRAPQELQDTIPHLIGVPRHCVETRGGCTHDTYHLSWKFTEAGSVCDLIFPLIDFGHDSNFGPHLSFLWSFLHDFSLKEWHCGIKKRLSFSDSAEGCSSDMSVIPRPANFRKINRKLEIITADSAESGSPKTCPK